MKVIIAGSRTITDYKLVKEFVDKQELDITEIVCGKASGVDSLGEKYALEKNIPVKYFPADWNAYGKSAGYKRNLQMGEYGDLLILIWDGKSKGSKLMKDIMIKNQKEIKELICEI